MFPEAGPEFMEGLLQVAGPPSFGCPEGILSPTKDNDADDLY